MNPNVDFAEQVQIVSGFLPADMQTAQNGDYISLKNYERVTVILFKAAGTAGDDPTITLQEAQDVSGTGVQALAKISKVYVKQDTVLTATGQFTLVEQAAASTYTDATSAEDAAIWVFDVKVSDLSEGFDCIRCNVGDTGTNAQLGALLYLLWPARYGEQALLSAIVD